MPRSPAHLFGRDAREELARADPDAQRQPERRVDGAEPSLRDRLGVRPRAG
jgi:hypothetical protein